MGEYYRSGADGVIISNEKAFKYFKRAAEIGGSDRAFINLAICYFEKLGPKEIEGKQEIGKKYIEKAEANGYEGAFYTISRNYYKGIGVEKDEEKGRKYLEEGAKRGELDCIFELKKIKDEENPLFWIVSKIKHFIEEDIFN